MTRKSQIYGYNLNDIKIGVSENPFLRSDIVAGVTGAFKLISYPSILMNLHFIFHRWSTETPVEGMSPSRSVSYFGKASFLEC
jgi:hypothetical protein